MNPASMSGDARSDNGSSSRLLHATRWVALAVSLLAAMGAASVAFPYFSLFAVLVMALYLLVSLLRPVIAAAESARDAAIGNLGRAVARVRAAVIPQRPER